MLYVESYRNGNGVDVMKNNFWACDTCMMFVEDNFVDPDCLCPECKNDLHIVEEEE